MDGAVMGGRKIAVGLAKSNTVHDGPPPEQRSPSTSSSAPISTTSTLPRRSTASESSVALSTSHLDRSCKNCGNLGTSLMRAGVLPRLATLKRRRCSRRSL
ncbi:hypothetical protein M885DRAFT_527094 [Pelagophyceae sp. CCMP2097]|nr:hypothetical protein M885DRAFT_527094 [Pelagophyceae sp. CCMP2097]